MSEDPTTLATLIGSRICHDLISPIGAITNGLELLELGGPRDGPELDLIADSVGNAGARIRFFRVAFGAGSAQLVSRTEVVSILTDISRGGRMSVHWLPTEDVPRSDVRLAFLALQCLETAMPFGGSVRIMRGGDAWILRGQADKLNFDPDLWHGMVRPGVHVQITPALVQFALLPTVLREQGRALSIEQDEGSVTLRF